MMYNPIMFAVYIHIPFCRTRCAYCDFVSDAIAGGVPDEYVAAVCREMSAFEGPDTAGSVYFGGGTPSLLTPAQVARMLATARRRFCLDAAEITLEANPDDLSRAKLEAWRDAGVNRLSIGVQSFDDDVLRYLGRRHNAAAAQRACEWVAESFENWSLDLIFGAHPVDRWAATLEQARALAPPHVSAYGLTYEAGTPFEQRSADAVDDEAWLALYQQTEEALPGYDHYEISNYAMPGRASRHNLVYWHNEAYAGFGTAAYSFVAGVRARNLLRTRDYLERPGVKAESLVLTEAEVRVETLIQHFRLREGLSTEAYARRFGRRIEDDFGTALDSLKARGLLAEANGRLFPTREGFCLNNEIGLALVGS